MRSHRIPVRRTPSPLVTIVRGRLFLILHNIACDLLSLGVRQRKTSRLLHVPVHLQHENPPVFRRPVGEGRKPVALGASGCEKACGGFCRSGRSHGRGGRIRPVFVGSRNDHEKDEEGRCSPCCDEQGSAVGKGRTGVQGVSPICFLRNGTRSLAILSE